MSDVPEQDRDPDLETTRQTPAGARPDVVAGRYRILGTLGRGGGGTVWHARDEHLGREVALKRVAGEADADVLLTRGMREARTSAALAHEHVVRVYDAFEHEGAPWIVMEYVPGPSLASLLEGGATLPVRQVAAIGAQMATALAAAHGAGVVHRDVKPGNVLLVDATGQDAKLTDFGIARAEEDHQLTRTGMVSGTAAYFSPEVAAGEDPSAAADVWALGATLYAAVEGRRPYPDAANPVAQLHTIVRDRPRPPQRAGALTPVLAGMLDPDPRTRWTARRAAEALRAVARGGQETGGAASAAGAGAAAAGLDGAGTAVAGAGAAAAAAAARTREEAAATQQVHAGADPTRVVAHGPPRSTTAGGGGDGAAPPADRAPAPSARRGRGRGRLLAWLVAVPLILLLGWLAWTIATTGGLGGTPERPTATAGQPVSVEEAEETAREFYRRLADEGLAEARELTLPGVSVDDRIAEGLDRVEVQEVVGTGRPDGGVDLVTTVAYDYGGPAPVVQQENLQVARPELDPLIVLRSTTTISGLPEQGPAEDQTQDQPAQDQPAEEAPAEDAPAEEESPVTDPDTSGDDQDGTDEDTRDTDEEGRGPDPDPDPDPGGDGDG